MTLLGGVISVKTATFLIFCIFAVSALGYGLGRITIKGITLGSAGVFITAMIFGCLFYPQLDAQLTIKLGGEAVHYTSEALKIVENVGLVFFVTSVGFLAGPKFFGNFKRNFKSYVLLGILIELIGSLTAVACIYIGRAMELCEDSSELTAMMAGLLSGAITSTPAFSAAKASVLPEYENAVSAGHGIAYIFGVIGIVLFVQIIPKITHADMDEERRKAVAVSNSDKVYDPEKYIKLDNFSFLSFSAAIVLGIVIGSIKIPLSSAGLSGTCFSLTTTGGCLLTSLIIGHFGHIGKINLMPTEHTLKVFRELGMMLFFVGAGIAGGASFIEYFNGWYFLFGIIMKIPPMFFGYFFAKYVLKLSLFNNLGSICGGMTSTPALGTLIHVTKSEDVASAYAATYPVALIAIVLYTQLIIILF